jgi:hypothetical protein
MCIEHSLICKCGKQSASFHFENNLMPNQIIKRLYCPDCSKGIFFDPISMIEDNGWIIEYDMDIASLYRGKLPNNDMDNLLPEMLFDKGYATWRGIYPGDHIDNVKERNELAKLAKSDPRKYFEEIKHWAVNRSARLRRDGWRKAYDGETVAR